MDIIVLGYNHFYQCGGVKLVLWTHEKRVKLSYIKFETTFFHTGSEHNNIHYYTDYELFSTMWYFLFFILFSGRRTRVLFSSCLSVRPFLRLKSLCVPLLLVLSIERRCLQIVITGIEKS
jgi:hypothetical protein